MPSDTWTKFDAFTLGRKTLTPGSEFTVQGERGARFRFHSYVETADGRCWINAFGGPHKVTMWRSFRPERISRITSLKPLARTR